MTVRIEVLEPFDYTFANRAMISFKAGWTGPVLDEVAEYALPLEKARAVTTDDGLNGTFAQLCALAEAEGIDTGGIAGTGPNGRVLKADVQTAIVTAREAKAGTPPTLPGNLPPELAEPDALAPNRHVAPGDETQ